MTDGTPKPNTTNSELDEILDYAEIFYNDSKWEERERITPTYTELKARLEALISNREKLAYKDGYIKGGIDEILRHEEARKKVKQELDGEAEL